MAYTIFGTLYNRYVLQLRGLDQIPQFSFESMKYHAREAVDWFKDIMTIMYENSQRRRDDGGGLPFRRPGDSPNAPNPFSHFTQSNAGNEFVRPQANRTESIRRHDINPVSHQNQVQNESQSIATSSQQQASSVPTPQPKDKHKPDNDILRDSAPQEKQGFMLDDDDEAGEEMDAMNSTSSQSIAPSATQTKRSAP